MPEADPIVEAGNTQKNIANAFNPSVIFLGDGGLRRFVYGGDRRLDNDQYSNPYSNTNVTRKIVTACQCSRTSPCAFVTSCDF